MELGTQIPYYRRNYGSQFPNGCICGPSGIRILGYTLLCFRADRLGVLPVRIRKPPILNPNPVKGLGFRGLGRGQTYSFLHMHPSGPAGQGERGAGQIDEAGLEVWEL